MPLLCHTWNINLWWGKVEAIASSDFVFIHSCRYISKNVNRHRLFIVSTTSHTRSRLLIETDHRLLRVLQNCKFRGKKRHSKFNTSIRSLYIYLVLTRRMVEMVLRWLKLNLKFISELFQTIHPQRKTNSQTRSVRFRRIIICIHMYT